MTRPQPKSKGTFVAVVSERDADAAHAALASVLQDPEVVRADGRPTPRGVRRLLAALAGEQRRRRHAFDAAGCTVVTGIAGDRETASRAVRALVDLDVHLITFDGERTSELLMTHPTELEGPGCTRPHPDAHQRNDEGD